jgi:hypothetical protein
MRSASNTVSAVAEQRKSIGRSRVPTFSGYKAHSGRTVPGGATIFAPVL